VTTRPKRAQRFGAETWDQRAGRDWSLWDLWFSVVAVLDHDGDLDALAAELTESIRRPVMGMGRAAEAKLSHLWDLASRLADAGLTVNDLADADVVVDKAVVRRASDKVTGKVSLGYRAKTPAMIDTPRSRLRRRARFGHWSAFPENPDRFYEKFRPTVQRKRHVTKGQSFAMIDRLVKRLRELDGPRRTLVDRLVLYRGFHTAALELADNADDSYGAIGEARTEAWLTYLSIDWRSTCFEPDLYWRDICELRIWEPYAIDHDDSVAWFGSATVDEVDLIETILLQLETEHRDAILDWEAEEALQALADLCIATGSHDRFVGVAQRLGSQWWQPIVAMATALVEAGKRNEAVAVFAAADQPGRQRDYLRRRSQALCGNSLAATQPPDGM